MEFTLSSLHHVFKTDVAKIEFETDTSNYAAMLFAMYAVLKAVIDRAIKILSECNCDPSCYKCLRSYENQKVHEILDRNKALEFLSQLCI